MREARKILKIATGKSNYQTITTTTALPVLLKMIIVQKVITGLNMLKRYRKEFHQEWQPSIYKVKRQF
jgi:hypothetical protein